MTGSNPYFVRKGDFDEEGLVRAVRSCLTTMNDPRDVYGSQIDGNAAMGDTYTYPAPDDLPQRGDLTPGYYYIGHMVELAESTPPPVLEPGLTAHYGVAQPDNRVTPPIDRTPASETHLRGASHGESIHVAPANTPDVYNQDLPYAAAHEQSQDAYSLTPRSTTLPAAAMNGSLVNPARHSNGNQGFNLSTATAYPVLAPALPTQAAYPVLAPAPPPPTFAAPTQTHYQPPTAIMSPSQNILTLPLGSRVGQPVPANLRPIITVIRGLPTIANTGHPERKILKKPFEGSYHTAAPEQRLIRDHFLSGSGVLKKDSELMLWYGDETVFEARVWEFLAVQRPRFGVRV